MALVPLQMRKTRRHTFSCAILPNSPKNRLPTPLDLYSGFTKRSSSFDIIHEAKNRNNIIDDDSTHVQTWPARPGGIVEEVKSNANGLSRRVGSSWA